MNPIGRIEYLQEQGYLHLNRIVSTSLQKLEFGGQGVSAQVFARAVNLTELKVCTQYVVTK